MSHDDYGDYLYEKRKDAMLDRKVSKQTTVNAEWLAEFARDYYGLKTENERLREEVARLEDMNAGFLAAAESLELDNAALLDSLNEGG